MRNHTQWIFILLFITGSAVPGFCQSIITQSSPDQRLVFKLRTSSDKGIQYQVIYQQKTVIDWSVLGLQLGDTKIPDKTVTVGKAVKTTVDETFPWLFGENAMIRNKYQSVKIPFQQGERKFWIEVRVFNDNIAFRYQLSSKGTESIFKELTGFQFNNDYTAYQHHHESVFMPVSIQQWKGRSDFPLVLASKDLFISINEAKNNNYTKAELSIGNAQDHIEVSFVKDTVQFSGNFYSPWRTITFSNTAIGLCKHTDLLYKLNDPAPAGNYQWIKPGKLIRDMTLTTQGAIDCIDFAQKMNFQYIMFDAGWYGKGYYSEFDQTSHPNKVVKEIDMPRVIAYGKAKDIGLILYVNYVGLRKYDIDSSYALYKSWGVKGLKFGFVNGITQDGISWLEGAVKKAQTYGFIVDVHDNYKPTGLSRTYPAWLTQEGVRGNENDPDAFHNTTLPFTRFLSGAADYTFCYRNQNDSFNNTLLSKKLQVSQAQQLALTVIFYSPIQSMLWYGRPADYQKPTEIEFFSYVPTTWDQTIPVEGEIGKYITIARRKGDTWFIGSAAGNDSAYHKNINLSFLPKGQQFTATIYSDDHNGGIRKTQKLVTSKSVLSSTVEAKGGEAVIIRPKSFYPL